MHDQRLTLAARLLERHKSQAHTFPRRDDSERFLDGTLALLFPHFAAVAYQSEGDTLAALEACEQSLLSVLRALGTSQAAAALLTDGFVAELGELQRRLTNDAEAIHRGDPAAKSVDEVILAYPGFLAIAVYRIAHHFYQQALPLFPRMLTEYAHRLTGIDIHPGATIGNAFCIDHGTGIVIGETTIIEDDVKLYQGVTLGGLSVHKRLADKKRHPTIESNVVVYANATILGGSTTIGHHSVIGGNVWLTESVAPYSRVYHQGEVRVEQPNTGVTKA